MNSKFSGRCKLVIGFTLIILGASFIMLRSLQMPINVEGYNIYVPTLYLKEEPIKIYLEDGPEYIVHAFMRAIEDWDKAVQDFNNMKTFECRVLILFTGCEACLSEPRLPRIKMVEEEYNVVVEFVNEVSERNIVAYTEPYFNNKVLARIVVWEKIPEHRAYQVAVHEIARLYGVDIPEIYRTLFGAVPAGSDTSKLHPSMEQFMNGPADPMKVTTLDLYIAYNGLENPGIRRVDTSNIVFRAYDEPDFTIPALISPILITLGLYLYLKHRGVKNV